MLTALILLSLSQPPLPSLTVAPLSHACESATVERPGLSLELPEWAFVVRPESACEASAGVAAMMYSLGIDAAEAVTGEEYQGDVYEDVTP